MTGKPWLRVKWGGCPTKDLESCRLILQYTCQNLDKSKSNLTCKIHFGSLVYAIWAPIYKIAYMNINKCTCNVNQETNRIKYKDYFKLYCQLVAYLLLFAGVPSGTENSTGRKTTLLIWYAYFSELNDFKLNSARIQAFQLELLSLWHDKKYDDWQNMDRLQDARIRCVYLLP